MRVRQIVLNLLFNAVKFTDSGSVKFHVALARRKAAPGGSVRIAIEVEDTGIGFSPDMTLRLFQEFEQGEAATGRQPGGIGLGLRHFAAARARNGWRYHCPRCALRGRDVYRDFAVRRRGTQSVEKRTLRRDQVLHEMRSRSQPTSASHGGGTFSVLVAEDNEINALLARKVIERAGGRTIIVKDGRSAIAAIWDAIERPPFSTSF